MSINFVGSEDGKLTCGYSSYIGRRSTMEDCYDIKLTTIDGQPVNLFGVFDGNIFSLALLSL
jgi:protein phosphatase 1L